MQTQENKKIIRASDRDSGLYLLEEAFFPEIKIAFYMKHPEEYYIYVSNPLKEDYQERSNEYYKKEYIIFDIIDH